MNLWPSMPGAWEAVGIPAVQITVIVALTAMAALRLRRAGWRRVVWQAGLVCVALLAVELATGFGRNFYRRHHHDRQIARAALSVPEPVKLPITPAAPAMEQVADTRAFQEAAGASEVVSPVVLAHGTDVHTDANENFPLLIDAVPVVAPVAARTPAPVAEEPMLPWWVLLVWILGVVVVMARVLAARWHLLRLGTAARDTLDTAIYERAQSLASQLGMRRRVRVIETDRVHAPIVYGLLRPTLAVPAHWDEEFTARQREAMLTHELAHLAAHDPAWYLFTDIVTAMLWWHPAVWWARAQLHATSEIAADEASLLLANGPDTLAECLVQLARQWVEERRDAGIGVEGDGFRSRLGRRVERLLALEGQRWRPLSRARSFGVQAGVPLVLLVVILLSTGWMAPGWLDGNTSWRCSFQGALDLLASATLTQPPGRPAEVKPRVTALPPMGDPRVTNSDTATHPPATVFKMPGDGRVAGVVNLAGVPPPELEINPLNLDALSARGGVPLKTRYYVVSPEAGLADALVYVKRGLEGRQFPAPTNAVQLEARGLEWHPYIVGVQTGQPVHFLNTDPGLLNVHPMPTNWLNPEFNKAMMEGTRQIETRFAGPEFFLKLKDDVNTWMYAYLCVMEHPYFAVTDGEGRFAFPTNLPPGKYTLGVLHRKAGEAEVEVELDGKEDAHAQFWLSKGTTPKPVQLAAAGDVIPAQSATNPPPKAAPTNAILSSDGLLPVPNPFLRTNVGNSTTVGRAAILAKLENIRFDEVHFPNVPFTEVLKKLDEEVRKKDPEGKGLNFILNPFLDNLPGAPGVAGGRPKLDFSTITVEIDPPLRDLRLLDVLQVVCRSASQPVKYVVEDYAVAFVPKGAEPAVPVTRIFKVDPSTFMQGLENVQGAPVPGTGNQNGNSAPTIPRVAPVPNGNGNGAPAPKGGRPSSSLTPTQNDKVRDFFAARGLDFSTNQAGRFVPQIMFNDQNGSVLVRAEPKDMTLIERELGSLGVLKARMEIELQYAQMKHIETNGFYFNGIATRAVTAEERQARMEGFARTNGAAFKRAPELLADDRKLASAKLDPGYVIEVSPTNYGSGYITLGTTVTVEEAGAPNSDYSPLQGKVTSVYSGQSVELTVAVARPGVPTVTELIYVTPYLLTPEGKRFLPFPEPPQALGAVTWKPAERNFRSPITTASQLDAPEVDHSLKTNAAPPEVQIEVRFVDLPVSKLAAAGLQPFTVAGLAGLRATNAQTVTLRPTEQTNRVMKTMPVATVSAVLSAGQADELLARLEKTKEVNILKSPAIRSRFGEKAIAAVQDETSVVVGMTVVTNDAGKSIQPQSKPFRFGPEITVRPALGSEDKVMQLATALRFTEFLGYEDPREHPEEARTASAGYEGLKAQVPLPLVREHSVQDNYLLRDGQTLLISGEALAGQKPKGSKEARRLFILMTAKQLGKDGAAQVRETRLEQAPPIAANLVKDEAARREESMVEIRRLLAEAQRARKEKRNLEAAPLCEQALRLVDRLGDVGVQPEKRMAIDGLTEARLAMAKEAFQRGDYDAATRQVDLLLNFVPDSEAGKQFRKYNVDVQAASKGRRPSPEVMAKMPHFLARKADTSQLVQDGKLLFEMRLFDEAELKLKEALVREPDNKAAYYYLSLIQEARYGDEARKRDFAQKTRLAEVERAWNTQQSTGLPTPGPYVSTGLQTDRLRPFIYKANTNTFLENIRRALEAFAERPASEYGSGAEALVWQYFAHFGVRILTNDVPEKWSEDFTRQPYAFIRYDEHTGAMTMRATISALEIISGAIVLLEPKPNAVGSLKGGTNSGGLMLSNPYLRTNLPPISSVQRRIILSKLNDIKIDTLAYQKKPLPDVLSDLDRKAKAADSSHKGINFIVTRFMEDLPSATNQVGATSVQTPTSAPRTDAFGAPLLGTNQREHADWNPLNVLITIDPPLHSLTLYQALEAICRGSDMQIKYVVEDYAIVITRWAPELPLMYTKIFKVESTNFVAALERQALALTNGGPNPFPSLRELDKQQVHAARATPTILANDLLRLYLRAAGLDFGPTNRVLETASPTTTAKVYPQVFFNDRNGTLIVRATLQDLDIVQTVIDFLNQNPVGKSDVPTQPLPKQGAPSDQGAASSSAGRTSTQLKPPSPPAAKSEHVFLVRRLMIDRDRWTDFVVAMDRFKAIPAPVLSDKQAIRALLSGDQVDHLMHLFTADGKSNLWSSARVKMTDAQMTNSQIASVALPDNELLEIVRTPKMGTNCAVAWTRTEFVGYDDAPSPPLGFARVESSKLLPRFKVHSQVANLVIGKFLVFEVGPTDDSAKRWLTSIGVSNFADEEKPKEVLIVGVVD